MPGSMLTVSCPCGLSGGGTVGISFAKDKVRSFTLVYDHAIGELKELERNCGMYEIDEIDEDSLTITEIPDPSIDKSSSSNMKFYRCPRCGADSLKVVCMGNWD